MSTTAGSAANGVRPPSSGVSGSVFTQPNDNRSLYYAAPVNDQHLPTTLLSEARFTTPATYIDGSWMTYLPTGQRSNDVPGAGAISPNAGRYVLPTNGPLPHPSRPTPYRSPYKPIKRAQNGGLERLEQTEHDPELRRWQENIESHMGTEHIQPSHSHLGHAPPSPGVPWPPSGAAIPSPPPVSPVFREACQMAPPPQLINGQHPRDREPLPMIMPGIPPITPISSPSHTRNPSGQTLHALHPPALPSTPIPQNFSNTELTG